MANQPIFVANYRHDVATLRGDQLNSFSSVFTPGSNGTRLHGIVLNYSGTIGRIVEFGQGETLLNALTVVLAPGAAPAADPFTITRSAGSFITDGWRVGDIIVLGSDFDAANRGDYRIGGVSDTVLTLENPGITPVLETNVTVSAYRWRKDFQVDLRPGFQQDILRERFFPCVGDQDPWMISKQEIHARWPYTSNANGHLYIQFYGGDY